jgi:hypothetical protein
MAQERRAIRPSRKRIECFGQERQAAAACINAAAYISLSKARSLVCRRGIPDGVRCGLEIVPVSRMDEVLGHALTRKPVPIVWDEASAKPAVDTPAEEKSSARTAH